VDFGTVRVADTKQLPLVLKNNGRYAVRYAFTGRTAAARELFTLVPESGLLEPGGKEAVIAVVFNQAGGLAREVALASAPDLQLAIIEPLTAAKADTVPIRLSVRAVFSRYSITPARGIIFGPVTNGTTTKPRTFEITNSGVCLIRRRVVRAPRPSILQTIRSVRFRNPGPARCALGSVAMPAGDFAFDWSVFNLGGNEPVDSDGKKASALVSLLPL
jgi:hypothetical protein